MGGRGGVCVDIAMVVLLATLLTKFLELELLESIDPIAVDKILLAESSRQDHSRHSNRKIRDP